MAEKSNIYTIYASVDEALVFQLLHRLKSLEKDQNVHTWYDDPIHCDQLWQPREASRIDQTNVFLLMLSNAFMHSEFVKQLEFKQVIDRYKAGEAKIIPIILDDCPWDTNFESDEYNFSFKELHVLPEGGKPVKSWDSLDKVFKNVASHIEHFVEFGGGITTGPSSVRNQEKEPPTIKKEDQLAMDFKKEAEAKRLAEERRIRDEKVRMEAAEHKLKQEAEAAKKVEEEKRIRQEIEAQRMATEERSKKEAEYQKGVEEERRTNFEQESVRNSIDDNGGVLIEENRTPRKRIFIGLLIVALGIAAILFFSKSGNGPKEETPPVINSDTIATQDSVGSPSAETIVPDDEGSTAKLAIGDSYDGGIVFEIAPSGKTGKIAHQEDAGPMPWQDAMKIDMQLGEGWRLPTLEELQIMYRTIGPGADNSGRFDGGLYWSATDYDEYQARLLRFRDGNASYHYNKAVEGRRFLVRAVRDFSR
ncbi:TIR domain-containing protein [Maribacter algicola]|uniref:TIR domain-containing protein n=1 Tax=Meishania litoralis TaxID=3434685 RepID=A0ACC7LLW0_9FLAO